MAVDGVMIHCWQLHVPPLVRHRGVWAGVWAGIAAAARENIGVVDSTPVVRSPFFIYLKPIYRCSKTSSSLYLVSLCQVCLS